MSVIGIDPGTTHSAAVFVEGVPGRWQSVRPLGIFENERLRDELATGRYSEQFQCSDVACEWIESMGMAVGKETFETVYWIGRFFEVANAHYSFHRITRRQVKLNLCGNMRAKDANIRQALLDRFGGSSAVGKKKTPGPLFGITSHQWSALAVGLTFIDLQYAEMTKAI